MKNLFILFSLLIGVLLIALLQISFSSYFFYIEQSQLFLSDSAYFLEKISLPGGFACWLSESAIQYFSFPYVGSISVGLLITAVAILSGLLLKHLSGSWIVALLGWLPAISLLCITLDFNYVHTGNSAFLICLLLANVYIHIRHIGCRLSVGLLSVLSTAWLCGPVYMLLAIILFIYELSNKNNTLKDKSISSILLITAFVVAFYYYRFCLADTFLKGLLPSFYYTLKLEASQIIYTSWALLLLLVIIAGYIPFNKNISGKMRLVVWAAETVILVIVGYFAVIKSADWKSLHFMKLDCYSRMGEWEKIKQESKGKLTNYLYMSLLCRALAEEGTLIDDVFRYDVRSEKALAISWNSTENISVLLSDLYFTCGNIALAQRMAFEADVCAHGAHNVRMIQRLVQTNLIFGAYPIADKYISLLEKSPVYKNWAMSHRKFLNNDKLVEEDPVLGLKKKLLFTPEDTNNIFSSGSDFVQALAEPLFANSEKAQTAFQYLACFYLLSRDMPNFISMIDRFKDVQFLSVLPRTIQEGILVAFERKPEKWNEYPLDSAIVSQYVEFRKQILSNRNNPGLAGLLHRSYGNTYWYYLMFSKR